MRKLNDDFDLYLKKHDDSKTVFSDAVKVGPRNSSTLLMSSLQRERKSELTTLTFTSNRWRRRPNAQSRKTLPVACHLIISMRLEMW